MLEYDVEVFDGTIEELAGIEAETQTSQYQMLTPGLSGVIIGSGDYDLQPTNEEAGSLLGISSRYAHTPLVQFVLQKISFRIPEPFVLPEVSYANVQYFGVASSDAYRPDRVATQMYNAPTHWWFTLLANNMIDFEQIETGMTLVVARKI